MYPSPNTVWWPESFSSPVGCIHTQGLISWPPDRAMCCQRRNPPTQGSFSCLCSFLPRLLAHAWIPPTQTLTHAATCLDLHPRPLPDLPSISSPCHPSPTQDSVFPPWPPSPIIPSSGHTTAHLEEEPPSPQLAPLQTHTPPSPVGACTLFIWFLLQPPSSSSGWHLRRIPKPLKISPCVACMKDSLHI